jgi:DNA-binding HxlR family transcriptional regulator
MRFTRVFAAVEGIAQKVLTRTLRQLECDGFVTRTLYPQVPPRVDYALTDLGKDRGRGLRHG